MSDFGWVYLINAAELAEQTARVNVEEQVYGDLVIPVKRVTPVALERPGDVRNILDWIEDELAHGRSVDGEGEYLVKEFFLSYGVPGIIQVAQFEPEWMFVEDLDVLAEDYPTIRERLGLDGRSAQEIFDAVEKGWDAQAEKLPDAVQLLRRLRGWCLLSQEDVVSLMGAFEGLPEDDLHLPGEWEEVFYQHRNREYDFAAFLFESVL